MAIIVQTTEPGQEPASVDFYVSNNASWNIPFQWVTRDGSPVDLTNTKMKIEVRTSQADMSKSPLIFSMSTDNSRILITNDVSGEWIISVAKQDIKDLVAGSYTYDILSYLENDPRVWRLQKGSIHIDQGVTR